MSGGRSIPPAPLRSAIGGGVGDVGPEFTHPRTVARPPFPPAARSSATALAICGAATLVPFIATTEPLRDPAAKRPERTRESSVGTIASGRYGSGAPAAWAGMMGPADD